MKMGWAVSLGLCLLGCLVFGSTGTEVEDASDDELAAKSPCPSGAFYFRQNCYEFFATAVQWDTAEAECQHLRQGGHLASFTNLREEKTVSAYIKRRSSTNVAWIGLNATPNSGRLTWEWSDGTPYTYGSSLWDSRSPSTAISSSHCVLLSNIHYPTYSSRWIQYHCDNSQPYVCKYKA